MKTYPISTDRDHYRGSNPSKQRKAAEYNRIAARVEKYLNDDLSKKPEDAVYQYLSFHVARELGEDADIVQRVIFGIDCGHNGVTIVKGDFERAMSRTDI